MLKLKIIMDGAIDTALQDTTGEYVPEKSRFKRLKSDCNIKKAFSDSMDPVKISYCKYTQKLTVEYNLPTDGHYTINDGQLFKNTMEGGIYDILPDSFRTFTRLKFHVLPV